MARHLEAFLHRAIPLTASMGLRVSEYDGCSLELSAPLEPNTNDKATAFGGSLASLLTLAGWGLLHVKLEELGLASDIVIHKSEFSYDHPIDSDFTARCQLPDEAAWDRFLAALERRGRARLELASWIGVKDDPAVTMIGRYAAMRRQDDGDSAP